MQAATSGDADALAVQTAAAQLQTLVSIGSSTLLGALAPEDQGTLAPDTFSYALYAALGDELLGDAAPAVLDLTNASVVERVLVAASRAPLQQAPENSTRPEVRLLAHPLLPLVLILPCLPCAGGHAHAYGLGLSA